MAKNIDTFWMAIIICTVAFVLCMIGLCTMDIWAPYAHCMSPEEIAELQRIADENWANLMQEK